MFGIESDAEVGIVTSEEFAEKVGLGRSHPADVGGALLEVTEVVSIGGALGHELPRFDAKSKERAAQGANFGSSGPREAELTGSGVNPTGVGRIVNDEALNSVRGLFAVK